MAQLNITGLTEVYQRTRLARLLGPRQPKRREGRRTEIEIRGDARNLKPRKEA